MYTKFEESKFFNNDKDKQRLSSPDEKDSYKKLSLRLLYYMDLIREHMGLPLVPTSGVRTPVYNSKIGGSPDSAHIPGEDGIGKAVDLSCPDSETRSKILEACFLVGIRRIGIGENFIHIDVDDSKDQDVTWVYTKRRIR